MQSDNEKMLQEIVQNTEMGKNTLDELMGLTHDQKLKDEMLRQKREYRRYAEPQAQAGKPAGVVMARVNEYWNLRQTESANAADCCLNMAAGILQLAVGTDDKAAVLARLEDGLFAVVTVGTPAAQMARKLQDALDNSRREFNISLSRRGSFTVQLASAEWGETPAWDMMFSLAQQRL